MVGHLVAQSWERTDSVNTLRPPTDGNFWVTQYVRDSPFDDPGQTEAGGAGTLKRALPSTVPYNWIVRRFIFIYFCVVAPTAGTHVGDSDCVGGVLARSCCGIYLELASVTNTVVLR